MSENIVNVQETIQTPQEKKLTKKKRFDSLFYLMGRLY